MIETADIAPRARVVLNFLLENVCNREIASAMNISERTVKFHVSKLLRRYAVRRRADLILLNYQRKLSARHRENFKTRATT